MESGFDNVPVNRRDEAFRMNDNGWAQQAKNIEAHLARDLNAPGAGSKASWTDTL